MHGSIVLLLTLIGHNMVYILGLPLPRPQIRFAHPSFVSCQYRSEHGNANERGLMSLRQGEMGENTPFTCKVSKKSINDVDHNRVTTLEFK